MKDSDPTMDLIHSLERADPTEWGTIKYGAPIFREHSVYEVDDGEGGKRMIVVPKGERAPAKAKCIHTVDKARLEAITQEINRNYAEGGKPIKIFTGHSDPKIPQQHNPEIVGFGRKAYMGTFGPNGLAAIKSDLFFKQGHENAASDYPERSAEFNPRTNAITGVALLKTDPRLPMGMLAFGEDKILLYGVGFMADDTPDETIDNAFPDKPADAPTAKPAAKPLPKAPDADKDGQPDAIDPDKDGDNIPNEDDADADGNGVADAAEANAGETSPAAPQAFQPHEAKFAERLMSHLEQNHPAIKHLCGEHKKYMDTQSAMAQPSPKPSAAGATNGYTPEGGAKKPKDDTAEKQKFKLRLDMSQTAEERLNYAETRLAKLEEENAILYANEALDALERQGKVIKDKPREVAKLVAMKTLEERQAHLQDIKINYADAERSPARHQSWLPVDAGHVEGAVQAEPPRIPETAEILQYAEENAIDISTEAGIAQAVKTLTKKSA